MNRIKIAKIAIMMVGDVLAILFAYIFALFLRFDFRFSAIGPRYLEGYMTLTPLFCLVTVVVFFLFHLYQSIWAYASTTELVRMMLAYLVIIAVYVIGTVIAQWRMPYSFYVTGTLIAFVLQVGIRYSYRFLRSIKRNYVARHSEVSLRTMVIGAGESARMLIREIVNSEHITKYRVVCAIDDDPGKRGSYIEGVEVVGGREMLKSAVDKYRIQVIIFAIPSATPLERREFFDLCNETGCSLKTVPGMYEIINNEVDLALLRDVSFEDLLGREPITIYNEAVFDQVFDRVVLVTGGGGSIGSELCRQIAEHSPRKLIIFDIYENNAYSIQQELIRNCPDLDLTVLIGSVRNTARVNSILSMYQPDLVFHAAAHKHVPLMEYSPCEAVKNNVFGTLKLAQAAAEAGVQKFVLISTDKAVNPTNVMGATKRICEMVIQSMAKRYPGTDFVAVRFGNVLGSNGSVIPLFKEQIASGGPVTVTDPRIIRYFMTIPEAVSLVLQASCYAGSGEIYVLDMGEPVKIDDMARKLIRLSGLEPDTDIEIKYTGLRPGEKLYEELLVDPKTMRRTENEKIFIEKPSPFDEAVFDRQIKELEAAAVAESPHIRDLIRKIVPTYRAPEYKRKMK